MGQLRVRVGADWIDIPTVGPQGPPGASSPVPYASLAELKAAVPTPGNGAMAVIVDEFSTLIGKGGTWRWWQKSFPHTTGANSWLTWGSGITAGSSVSALFLNGWQLTLMVQATVTTPATAFGTSFEVFAVSNTQLRSPVRVDLGAAGGHGTGAGSGRLIVQTDGSVRAVFSAGDNPTAITSMYGTLHWSVADLLLA